VASKNNPNERKYNKTNQLALSSECEICSAKCERGTKYLEKMARKHCGTGVPCKKKVV